VVSGPATSPLGPIAVACAPWMLAARRGRVDAAGGQARADGAGWAEVLGGQDAAVDGSDLGTGAAGGTRCGAAHRDRSQDDRKCSRRRSEADPAHPRGDWRRFGGSGAALTDWLSRSVVS
jgi:hypothetical protein